MIIPSHAEGLDLPRHDRWQEVRRLLARTPSSMGDMDKAGHVKILENG